MTPSIIANFMATLFGSLQNQDVSLLDAGAGIGSLTAAFTQKAVRDGAKSVQCELWELDAKLYPALLETLAECGQIAAENHVHFDAKIRSADFITEFSTLFSLDANSVPTHAILNPPYKKISSISDHRKALRKQGIETANLYSAFVALALQALGPGGELVAITPRSFCNGAYFKPFRQMILREAAIAQVHLFNSRTHAFKGDEVLQENIIFHLVKGARQGLITLTSSEDASFDPVNSRQVDIKEVVQPGDEEKIFHFATDEDQAADVLTGLGYAFSLNDLNVQVSTGPVVDFRLRSHLLQNAEGRVSPLIYSHHFNQGMIQHPKLVSKKPNYITLNDETIKWLMPTGFYVLTRRLSSKEERRRIIPALFDPNTVHAQKVGFENHLNVLHRKKMGLPADLARGLVIYLSSTLTDNLLRRFSGHTQVNAGDLRALRYPSLDVLVRWGACYPGGLLDQGEIDALVMGGL